MFLGDLPNTLRHIVCPNLTMTSYIMSYVWSRYSLEQSNFVPIWLLSILIFTVLQTFWYWVDITPSACTNKFLRSVISIKFDQLSNFVKVSRSTLLAMALNWSVWLERSICSISFSITSSRTSSKEENFDKSLKLKVRSLWLSKSGFNM